MTFKLLLFVFPALFNLKHREPFPFTNNYGTITVTRDSVPDTRDSLQIKKDHRPLLHMIPESEVINVSTSFKNGTLVVSLKDGRTFDYSMMDWDYEDYYRSTAPTINQAIKSIKITFTRAEQNPEFPGGADAWEKYLYEYNRQHQDEIHEYGPAEFKIRFIVHLHGQLTDISLESGNSDSKLATLAINCIKNGPAWIPAQQNKHLVPCYQVQSIKFSTRN